MPGHLLLCTDLDRTLIPNGPQPESAQAREHFARFAAHPQVTLAYVSGRDPVRLTDFQKVMRHAFSTVSKEELQRYQEWTARPGLCHW